MYINQTAPVNNCIIVMEYINIFHLFCKTFNMTILVVEQPAKKNCILLLILFLDIRNHQQIACHTSSLPPTNHDHHHY